MRTVGIIGGLGPETTAQFYLKVVFSSFEKYAESRPPMLIWNVPLPYRVEEDFITKAEGEDKYLPYLIDAAQRLEKGGADFIVIPCNSVHIFIEEVRASVHIPILSIIDETISFLKSKDVQETGILATSATIRKRLYEDKLTSAGISVRKPHDEDQTRITSIINHLVHSQHTEKDKVELTDIIQSFASEKLKTLILACTDLQLIVPSLPDIQIYDTMEILAHATVRELLA